VVGVEEEERKKEKKGGVGLRPYLVSSQSPSAADPRVMDLRAAQVEPNHCSSACGRAQDLADAPLLDLR
jgi:hypothetical protein